MENRQCRLLGKTGTYADARPKEPRQGLENPHQTTPRWQVPALRGDGEGRSPRWAHRVRPGEDEEGQGEGEVIEDVLVCVAAAIITWRTMRPMQAWQRCNEVMSTRFKNREEYEQSRFSR